MPSRSRLFASHTCGGHWGSDRLGSARSVRVSHFLPGTSSHLWTHRIGALCKPQVWSMRLRLSRFSPSVQVSQSFRETSRCLPTSRIGLSGLTTRSLLRFFFAAGKTVSWQDWAPTYVGTKGIPNRSSCCAQLSRVRVIRPLRTSSHRNSHNRL